MCIDTVNKKGVSWTKIAFLFKCSWCCCLLLHLIQKAKLSMRRCQNLKSFLQWKNKLYATLPLVQFLASVIIAFILKYSPILHVVKRQLDLHLKIAWNWAKNQLVISSLSDTLQETLFLSMCYICIPVGPGLLSLLSLILVLEVSLVGILRVSSQCHLVIRALSVPNAGCELSCSNFWCCWTLPLDYQASCAHYSSHLLWF